MIVARLFSRLLAIDCQNSNPLCLFVKHLSVYYIHGERKRERETLSCSISTYELSCTKRAANLFSSASTAKRAGESAVIAGGGREREKEDGEDEENEEEKEEVEGYAWPCLLPPLGERFPLSSLPSPARRWWRRPRSPSPPPRSNNVKWRCQRQTSSSRHRHFS